MCKQHKVAVFSSNYTLYGDLSHRVMSVIHEAWDAVEVYSIDEAFLDLSTLPQALHESFCSELQRHILQCTGIPTSIGVGPTKTLAKLANHLCKKELKMPVFNIGEQREWLKQVGVGDVWGIGRQWHKKLIEQGIYTAYDLAQKNAHALKAQFNVVLMRTIMELQGRPCAGLLVEEPKQSIMSSKSFGGMQTDLEPIAEAISSHCARAWEKLRRQGLAAQSLFVFVQTNGFRKDLPQYCKSMQFKLIHATDDLSVLTTVAKRCLNKLYRAGYQYKKVGVCLEGLIPKNQRQLDMFHQTTDERLASQEKVMRVIEGINQKYGRHSIRLAAEGYSKPWAMRAELKSPAYTTRWSDLPIVNA